MLWSSLCGAWCVLFGIVLSVLPHGFSVICRLLRSRLAGVFFYFYKLLTYRVTVLCASRVVRHREMRGGGVSVQSVEFASRKIMIRILESNLRGNDGAFYLLGLID